MFVERLVSLGKTFLAYGIQPDELLRLFSDVQGESRFLENVAVIEMTVDGRFNAAPLPLQTWGELREIESKKGKRTTRNVVFEPDEHRGLGLPFIRPRTGNPRVPQGRYGVPVYPFFPGDLEGLAESLDQAVSFLKGRLERTLFLPCRFSDVEIAMLGEFVQRFAGDVVKRVSSKSSRGYGLLALCVVEEDGPYRYSSYPPPPGDPGITLVGESVINPTKFLVADLASVVRRFRISKTQEGAEKGTGKVCTLCRNGPSGNEQVVSMYSKAWPWLTTTWHAPFPERHKHSGAIKDLASTVGALCPECYTALVLGAGVFREVSGALPTWLTKEMFLPVASAGGREAARRLIGAGEIRGATLVVPVAGVEASGGAVVEALEVYRRRKEPRPGRADLALRAITGVESTFLPEEFGTDAYRLLMVYFTESNADIHLRAMIEDVVPSTVKILLDVIVETLAFAGELRESFYGEFPPWLRERYNSVVYLLARAYGSCYLWPTLQEILHRRPISWERFTAGVAARMAGYAKLGIGSQDRAAYQSLREEVFLYLVFRYFYQLYCKKLLHEGGTELSDWRSMLHNISRAPAEDLRFTFPEELGFAAGYLVRRFGRQYYARTGKNFLQHRVMTFGSNLTPEDIWRRALSRFQEYALKLNLGLPAEFRQRAAIVECEYRRLREEVSRKRDDFMGAFWSGYMLSAPPGEEDEEETGDGSRASLSK